MRPFVLALALLPACKPSHPAPAARVPEPAVVHEAAAETEGAPTAPEAGSSAGSEPAVLRGRFLLGGRPAAGWTAGLGSYVAPVPLDAEGRFVLVSRRFGQTELVLVPEPLGPDALLRFIAQVELAPGEQRWSRDVPTGRLTGRVDREHFVWLDWLAVSWSSSDLSFLAIFNPEEDGTYALDLVPAGAVELRDMACFVDRKLATVQVERGETARRDLP